MTGQHQNIVKHMTTQDQINEFVDILTPFYNTLSIHVRLHRNYKYLIASDLELLGVMLYRMERRITSERQLHRELSLAGVRLPERSRFCRRCHDLAPVLQVIRLLMLQLWTTQTIYVVLDSAPIFLCDTVRNLRAKTFSGIANIGFNATKHVHFYGLKLHVEMTNQGYAAAYEVTQASVHDVKVVEELLGSARADKVLGDVGYLNRDLQRQLSMQGIDYWTPVRKNMKPIKPGVDDRLMRRNRRMIETLFSNLNTVSTFEHPRVRVLKGLLGLLESLLTWHTIKVHQNLMAGISGFKIV